MFNRKEEVDFILEVMQGKELEQSIIDFILEDFPEGGKIIIDEDHLFEILKVENGTVLMRPIGTTLLARDNLDKNSGITTRRYIQDGKIVTVSI